MSRLTKCIPAVVGALLLLLLLLLTVAPADGAPTANDPVFTQGLQWGLGRIGAPAAWTKASGQGITIAVVDSGADLNHEDLTGKIVGQVRCINTTGDPAQCSGSAQDDNGHGTHVAGIAAAATGNGIGIAGVAPDAQLLIVRALTNDCTKDPCTASGTSSDVSAGIRWAVDHGADVINLSLGGGRVQSTLGCSFCDAVDYAWSKGAIAVVAAGNDSAVPAGFSDEPAVIVTATTRDDTRASYSSPSSSLVRTARWPVAAPGGEAESDVRDCGTGGQPKGVVSTYWTASSSNQYACLAGTSMATPHVAGALAVLRSAGLSPQAAIDRLLATAKDLGPAGRDDTFGFGRIDVAAAVGATGTATTVAPATPPGGKTPPSTTRTTRSGAGGGTGDTSTSTVAGVGLTDPDAPVVTTPDTSEAAPFRPEPESGDDPPAPLVAIAVLAVLCSAIGTALTAWRLR